jgi:hypothetical protein
MLDDAPKGRPRWLVPTVLGGAFVAAVGGLALLGSAPDAEGRSRTVVVDATAKGVSHPGAAAGELLRPRQPEPAGDALAAELERRLAEDVEPLLDQFCYSCHGNGKDKGGVALDGVTNIAEVLEMADDWAYVRDVLNDRLMPPEDQPQPTQHQVLTINQWIDDALDYYPDDAEPDPGWYTIHRLNKSEYRNTLRDLLGIDPAELDVAAGLPPDDTGYGFDNNADVLSMSPLQVEKYLEAAERAIGHAIGSPVVVHDEPQRLRDLSMEGGGRALDRGGYYLYSHGTIRGAHRFEVGGEYVIHLEAWGDQGGDEPAKAEVRIDGRRVAVVDVPAVRREPGSYEVPVEVDAGRHRIEVVFINDYYVRGEADRNLAVEWIGVAGPVNVDPSRSAAYDAVFFVTPNATDDGERIEGAPGRRRLTESQAARQIIERFATRAFRRPVRRDESVALLQLYRESREFGDSYEDAVKLALTAALVSPNFLYRAVEHADRSDPASIHRLSGYELASRLSYFLWSSMPDDRLLDLAERGVLTEDRTLRQEVARMLADPRSDAFVENFAGQWLLLRNLERMEMDPERFAAFDSELIGAMRREAELFFADVLRAGRDVRAFVFSDYTFLNQRLAEHYGIAGVRGESFRRVELPAGSPRGGVLTMAAVLTVTSNPTRTSPVKRGQYVLDQLLGTPPPPPPPDIPPLEQAEVAEGATLREQLAAHVADPNCAVCHRRLDPLGLAMENFDAIGRWRDREGGHAIDASGELPGGVAFDGPTELKRILLDRDAQFVENLSRTLLMYALGRGLEPFDRPTVRQLTDAAEHSGGRMSAIIESIVLSDAFRSCRGRETR